MRKAVLFDEFACCCKFFNSKTQDGYGCTHPDQTMTRLEDDRKTGRCFCWSCPLGIEAEQEDLGRTDIDWDGLCEDDEVAEAECLLVNTGADAAEEDKHALDAYERYLHRYDKKWLNAHKSEDSQ